MWKVRGLPWHERRIYHTLTSISVFPFFQLLQLLECLSGYMCGDNLKMKFPSDSHDYTGLNRLVNSFPWFTVATPNELILGWKPHWSAKRKKTNMWEMVARRCSAKQIFQKFFKIQRETPVCQSLSNTVRSFHAIRLATFLKEDLLTGVLESSLIKLQAFRTPTLLKRDCNTDFFQRSLQNF